VVKTTGSDAQFRDDFEHPIPRVYAYDTVLALGNGGAYLGVVIASPLDASPRSLARLREKLRFYLESFFSDFALKEWKTPKEGKMRIYINIHSESCKDAFEIIGTFEEQAHGRGVLLRISTDVVDE